MSVKTYFISDKQNKVHNEYKITISDDEKGTVEYTMYHGSSDVWSDAYKDTKIMSVIDNGNGFVFSKSFGKKFDYTDMSELYILLQFMKTMDQPLYEGIISEQTIISQF